MKNFFPQGKNMPEKPHGRAKTAFQQGCGNGFAQPFGAQSARRRKTRREMKNGK
ncbi:MAG TPA: hypothetical protein IAA38_05105 [Candidatus Ruminococcus gallistercoris]|nr:hypothetical protein [Candidatus Ruminococcus gallistercoris]